MNKRSSIENDHYLNCIFIACVKQVKKKHTQRRAYAQTHTYDNNNKIVYIHIFLNNKKIHILKFQTNEKSRNQINMVSVWRLPRAKKNKNKEWNNISWNLENEIIGRLYILYENYNKIDEKMTAQEFDWIQRIGSQVAAHVRSDSSIFLRKKLRFFWSSKIR